MMVKDRPNTKYSDKLKQKILTENDCGVSVADLSQKYGIHAATIYNWRNAQAGKDNPPSVKDDSSTEEIVNKDGQEKIAGESYRVPPDKSNNAIDFPAIKKKLPLNGKSQTIQREEVFIQSDSRYVVTIDFNRRRDVLREVETIADINERTVEQQIIYICKKMKEAFD